MEPIDTTAVRAALEAERARLPGRYRRADPGTGPDDLRLTGGGRQPGIRAAAGPRAARSRGAASRRSSTPHSPGSTTAPSAPASSAVDRSRPGAWRRCPGPPTASTARRRSTRVAGDRSADSLGLDAIRAAAARPSRASSFAPRSSRSARRPTRVLLKAESLQPIGAFKIRGAYHAIASLTEGERGRGVITYSSGNHAQGVARAARLLGTRAVVVMPDDAPAIKRERVAADGAEIVVVGPARDERQARAEAIAAERGLAIIPPFDDDRIIAGQGTIGLEIVEDLPDLAAVLVPIGGGGLASGVADGDQGACARTSGSSASSRSWRRMRATRCARVGSCAGRPPTCRGRSPTARAPRRSADGRSPTCGRTWTGSSP